MNFCVVTLPMVDDTVLAPCIFKGKVTVQGLSPVGICTKMKVISIPGRKFENVGDRLVPPLGQASCCTFPAVKGSGLDVEVTGFTPNCIPAILTRSQASRLANGCLSKQPHYRALRPKP